MQCEYILPNQEQCPNSADFNKNFCTTHYGTRFSSSKMRPDLKFRSDRAFTPHVDKLTKTEKGHIDGYYKSQHPKPPKPKNISPKPTESIVEPEPPKEPTDILSQPILTIRELSQYLKVSMLTLKRWEAKGKIKSIRINSRGDRRYLKEEIQRFLGQ